MKAKSILAGVTAAALFASSAIADATTLPAGKPAGTKQATLLGLTGLPLLAVIAATTLVVVAAAGGFDSSSSTGTSS